MNGYLAISIFVMAGVTYLIRMLPLAVFQRKIRSRFVRSFLYYIPYAVLSAMTVPAIFTSTGNWISSAVGCAAAVALGFMGKKLLTVALAACGAAYVAELVIRLIG